MDLDTLESKKDELHNRLEWIIVNNKQAHKEYVKNQWVGNNWPSKQYLQLGSHQASLTVKMFDPNSNKVWHNFQKVIFIEQTKNGWTQQSINHCQLQGGK